MSGRRDPAKALPLFLKAQKPLPFAWRVSDCFRLPGAWVEERTGFALPWPDYGTEAEALALIAEAGGPVPLADAMLQRVGWGRVAEPVVGAVGIIPVTGVDAQRVEVGAIWTGRRWMARAKRGLWGGPAEPLAIWMEAGHG